MPFRAQAVIGLEQERQLTAKGSIAAASRSPKPRKAIADTILREGRVTRWAAYQEARNSTAADLAGQLKLTTGGHSALLDVAAPRISERYLVKASKRLGREYERKFKATDPAWPEERRRAQALRKIESDVDRIVATEFWLSTNTTREAVAKRAERLTAKPIQRVWNASLDSRTCSICAGRHGKVTRDVPPAHTLCRCWVDFAPGPSEQDVVEAQEQLERTQRASAILKEVSRANAAGARYYRPDLTAVARHLEFLHDPVAKAEQIARSGGYERHAFKIVALSEIDVSAVWQASKLGPIAQGFASGSELPPVSLARDSASGKWKIQDGIHRANQARAAKHTHVPAVTTQWVQVRRKK